VSRDRKLVIVGTGAFAEVASLYFHKYSGYEIACYAVERAYLKTEEFRGRPVVAIEDLPSAYPPDEHDVHVAIVYTQLNRLRPRLVAVAKAQGYRLASFVSPHAFVGPEVAIGEHCFIFENNVVQPFASLGNNVVLWSGNHIGHHSRIEDNVFVSSHVVISGYCHIGQHSFLGVNSALADKITVGPDCWIGPGVTVTQDVSENQILRAADPVTSKVSARRFFRIPTE